MRYYSPGKLLITGEYLVLDGATALAVPARFGQWLEEEEDPGEEILYWESYEKGRKWFSASIGLPGFNVLSSSDKVVTERLIKLFHGIQSLNPGKFNNKKGYRFKTNLEFDISWGLGSSSTLISNLAAWAGVDPYALLAMYSKGSGYDIACARSSGPLLYTLRNGNQPETENVTFNPGFRDHIFFIYSGKKQVSEESVLQYLVNHKPEPAAIENISAISRSLAITKDLTAFNRLISEHESIISGILGLEPIKNKHFSDFPGEIKSLGAWGGDFLMASSATEPQAIRQYFISRGLPTIFTFNELVR